MLDEPDTRSRPEHIGARMAESTTDVWAVIVGDCSPN